jgi:HrpA-like RNA helicase
MSLLPIESVLPALRDALSARNEVVLEAAPGEGKTTRVPIALLAEPRFGCCVVVASFENPTHKGRFESLRIV